MQNYELGIIVGLEQAANKALDESASWYRNGTKDVLAEHFRTFGQRLMHIAKAERAVYDGKYHADEKKASK